MKITYADLEKENWFLITWDLSNKCNYRCSYCPEILHNGSSGWPELADAIQFIDRVNQKVNKKICFRFSGGEPTYWSKFLELAAYITSKGNYFSFLTNGSRDIGYFRKIDQYADGVMLSYHPEYAKVSHFISISNALHCPVVVNLMLIPENFTDTVKIAQEIFENSNAAIWPKVILDKTSDTSITNTTIKYTDEQMSIITNWPYFRNIDDSKIHRGNLVLDNSPMPINTILLEDKNRYNGWQCWGGIDMIHVNAWGNVYRSDCKQALLGTLNDFELPSDPITCTKLICGCLSDLYLRKESL